MSDLVKLLDANVEKKGNDECWPWTGRTLEKDSRGIASIDGKTVTAPRISWEVHNGAPPPAEMFVCHSCDNPNCVNPNHLWLGSNKDNLRDAASKGRIFTQRQSDHIKGSKHGNAKMTEETVLKIRADFANGESIRSIAKKYGMSFNPVWMAIRRRAWTHV